MGTIILSLGGVQPYILDAAIDHIDTDLYMRDDIDHQVYLVNNQDLYYNTDTKEIKTVASGGTP